MNDVYRRSVNITANANHLISGNFSANLIDFSGVNRTVEGRFENIPVKP